MSSVQSGWGVARYEALPRIVVPRRPLSQADRQQTLRHHVIAMIHGNSDYLSICDVHLNSFALSGTLCAI
jgi:hypothetical protein